MTKVKFNCDAGPYRQGEIHHIMPEVALRLTGAGVCKVIENPKAEKAPARKKARTKA